MPTPHETPHDVNLVDQMGYVNICGVGTIRTFVVGLTWTQRHKVITKTFRTTWQVYLHGHFPGNIVSVPAQTATSSVKAKPGHPISIKGWQIMPYTNPAAAVQRACIHASSYKVDGHGYKILFHETRSGGGTKFSSHDVILCDWLGSKYQLTN